ncbi:hypothetical protein EDB19DRAFT_1830853 [Suillus lakei]|nr:hypothetical protein EDB19DRAFT_1830853 [Suillus lakei]
MGQAIIHVFPISVDHDTHKFNNPKACFQYSLGDGHGGRKNVVCHFLRDSDGKPIHCNRISTSCKGLKACIANINGFNTPHSYTHHTHVSKLVTPQTAFSPYNDTAKREVFMKTFAFFCALQEHGCAFQITADIVDIDIENDVDNEDVVGTAVSWEHSPTSCPGKLIMRTDRCEYCSSADRAHLILQNLQEFNVNYLQALLTNNLVAIASHEENVARHGYGPLVLCSFVDSLVEHKQTCAHWHRNAAGILERDATPRRIVCDSGFMKGLCTALGWTSHRSPNLADLHPSLANLDHVDQLIKNFCYEKYPMGTGFEGVRLLVDKDNQLPHDAHYHLHGWQEFEIEAWDNNHMRSLTGTRAFITSQSAQAHLLLFRCIFAIASEDTGMPVLFKHIHGSSYESVVADAHMGQGLGLGMFCMELCANNEAPCIYKPHRQLRQLNAYDHLRRFYRLCIVHFKRNVLTLRTHVSKEVYIAMLSLSSSEAQPNLQQTLDTINWGGRKARAWLKNKVETNKFALPALYRPASFIPEDTWRACPATTNGNEQAHRNVNCDSVNLTLLGGIMRGRAFDD